MAWDKIVTADVVVQRCIEGLGLYQKMNRSYDALVEPGATSVRRPRLSLLTVRKNTGAAYGDVARKKAKADTTMVETSLDVYAVGIANEMAARFESNQFLLNQYEISMSMSLEEQFDADCIVAAQAGGVADTFATSGVLTWKDLIKGNKIMTQNKVPRDGRVQIIPANLEDQFLNLDVITRALAYGTIVNVSKGKFIQLADMTYYITALSPLIAGKDVVTTIYCPGLAFILSNYGVIEDAYDAENLGHVYDMLAHAAAELDDPKFGVVISDK